MGQGLGEVKTVAALANVTIAASMMHRAMKAAPHLSRMIVFNGPSGFGKSMAASYLAVVFGAYYVEAKSTWTRATLLQKILQVMGITPDSTTVNAMLDAVCAQLAASGRPLIVDEMDYLVDKGVTPIIQDICEGGQAVVMMIGEENLPKKLIRWEKVHGRVLDWKQAQPADLDDAATLASFYCRGVEVAPDLLAHIHAAARGSARRICVNLELVQEEAIMQGLKVITLADWGKKEIYTGEPPRRGA